MPFRLMFQVVVIQMRGRMIQVKRVAKFIGSR